MTKQGQSRRLASRLGALAASFAFVLLPSPAVAVMTAQMDIQPRALTVGEAAICSITVRGADNPPTPQFPQIPGFQVGMAGTERSMSFGSGGSDSSVTFRYRLIPMQTGKFVIGPFQYSADSETADLPAITVEVVPPGSPTGETSGKQPEWSELLFAQLSVPSTNIYNQQVFDITLSVFSRGLNLGPDVGLMNMPAVGLSLSPFQEMGATREVVNNQLYDVRRFRAKATALTSGTFSLAPTLRLALRVERQRQRNRDPFFGDFPMFDGFFGRYETQPVDVTPKPVEVVVRPLPDHGKPAGFSGAVGQFAFSAQARPTELNAGEPITLSMQIAGDGNIENVSAPEVKAGDGFKIYECKLISKDVDPTRATGRKTFEQVLIPRSSEAKLIPEIEFVYFDPASSGYKTLRQGPFPLRVAAVTNLSGKVVQAQGTATEIPMQLLGSDIIYLKPAPAEWKPNAQRPWFAAPGFLALQLVPPGVLAFAALLMRRRRLLESDVAFARRQQAPKSARAAVAKASAALTSGERRAFFEAVAEALGSYFGHRLNLPPGAATSDVVLPSLQKAGIGDDLLRSIDSLFRRCEEERFGTVTAEEHKAVDGCRDVLTELHRVLKACERIKR